MKNKLITEAAVAWWAKQLQNPEYSDRNNGGLEGFASIIASFAKMSVSKKVSESDVEKFKQILRQKITDFFDKYEGRDFILRTDWAPEEALAEACREIDCAGTELPLKTIMFIDPVTQTVKVSKVGSETILIYPA